MDNNPLIIPQDDAVNQPTSQSAEPVNQQEDISAENIPAPASAQPQVEAQPQVQPQPQAYPQPPVYTVPQGQPVYPGYVQQPPVISYTPQPQPPQYYGAPQGVPYGQPVYQQPPSVVYYNNNAGTAPCYHYGNPTGVVDNSYYIEQQRKREKARQYEKSVRRLGTASGGALGICYALAMIFSLVFLIEPISQAFESSVVFSSFLQIVYSIIVVGGAFLLMRRTIANTCVSESVAKSNHGVNLFPIKLDMPKDIKKTVLLLVICFGGCMAANIISSIFVSFFEVFGLYPPQNDDVVPTGVFDVIMLYLSTALVPGLVEEFAMRGVLMTPMRKYGNAFAIFASALIFGVFHGNMSQIPFAFICGVFFGYISIVTDSLWPAIIAHILNNTISCTFITIDTFYGTDASNGFYYAVIYGGILLALLALVVYLKKYKNEDIALFKNNNAEISEGKKFAKFIGAPLMVIMLIVHLFEAFAGMSTEMPTY